MPRKARCQGFANGRPKSGRPTCGREIEDQLPFAEIEVEYLNTGGKVKLPADAFTTQVVKADANGVFAYTMPRAGWWGFAALNGADFKLAHEGRQKDVELGAVIWVEFQDMK